MTKEEILKQYYSISLPEEGGIFEAMEEYAKDKLSEFAAELLNDSRQEVHEKEWIRDLYMLACDLTSNAGLNARGKDFECLKKAHNYLVVEKLI